MDKGDFFVITIFIYIYILYLLYLCIPILLIYTYIYLLYILHLLSNFSETWYFIKNSPSSNIGEGTYKSFVNVPIIGFKKERA